MPMANRIRVTRGQRYECFECGHTRVWPIGLPRCPNCGEQERFHVMD
jgi:predicted RNA-binding Zn-ribbon protein involved in translation (DUF1610 family)